MTDIVDTPGQGRLAGTAILARLLDADGVRRLAALATAVAGVAHYVAVPAHRTEWWVAAVALTLIGALQLGWGVLAWQADERDLLLFGLGINVLVLATWLASVTTGLPFGPHAGVPEPVGTAGLTAGLAEAAAVATIIAAPMLRARRRDSTG